jgi:hypothetical protein
MITGIYKAGTSSGARSDVSDYVDRRQQTYDWVASAAKRTIFYSVSMTAGRLLGLGVEDTAAEK